MQEGWKAYSVHQPVRCAWLFPVELTGTWGCATQRELHDLWLGQNKTSLLTFTPCDLLRLIRGRTVWLSGDSQQQDMMKALMCFLFEVAPPLWQRLVRAVEALPL